MKSTKRYDCLEQTIKQSTRSCYKRDIDRFWAWAAASKGRSRPSYPISHKLLIAFLNEQLEGLCPQVVSVMRRMGHKVSGKPLGFATLKRYFISVSVEHMTRDLPSPTSSPAVRLTAKRIWRRAKSAARPRAPITADIMNKLLASCGDDLRGVRDRALLLVAYAGGGRRRCEIASLRVEDLKRVKNGYIAHLAYHKMFYMTHQPLIFPILGQAADALDNWLTVSGIKNGPVFRGIHRSNRLRNGIDAQTFYRVVKRLCKSAGLPADKFGAHSIRVGFLTQALADGMSFTDIMQISGHRSLDSALKYIRHSYVLTNRASWLASSLDPLHDGKKPASTTEARNMNQPDVLMLTARRKSLQRQRILIG